MRHIMEYSTLIFWIGTVVFVGTYVLIASEKVHKTVAALLGAMLMLLVILAGTGPQLRGTGSGR